MNVSTANETCNQEQVPLQRYELQRCSKLNLKYNTTIDYQIEITTPKEIVPK